MSQEGLAERLNVTPATINRYEKGHRIPDADFLNHLVREFKCDPGWLLTGEMPIYPIYKEEEVPLKVSEEPAPYRRGEDLDPLLSQFLTKLKIIYRKGNINQRAIVRGTIDEVYEDIKRQGKDIDKEEETFPEAVLKEEGQAGKKTS